VALAVTTLSVFYRCLIREKAICFLANSCCLLPVKGIQVVAIILILKIIELYSFKSMGDVCIAKSGSPLPGIAGYTRSLY